jgi:hypothetical protein
MKSHRFVITTAALATAAIITVRATQAGDPVSTIDPGFVPDTGQINTGHAAEPWSDALRQAPQPPQEEARAALMMPDNGAPSVGPGPTPASNGGEQLTTASTSASTTAGEGAVPVGPIGATTQTMPAKFSHRNDVLDRVPATAWPLPLNKQQREQIYNAVMADNSHPAVGAATLKPSDTLSFDQTRDLHPLPQAVAGIDGLHGLEYLKGKNKVLLVRPPNAIVVDEITL